MKTTFTFFNIILEMIQSNRRISILLYMLLFTSILQANAKEYDIYGSQTINACQDYIRQMPNGDIQLSATFATARAYVEVFATKNDLQHLATNITASQIANADGTFTYSYVVPASFYVTGDKIQTRFYSYVPNGPGVFTPGTTPGIWSDAFFYNETECDDTTPPTDSCTDYIQQLSNGNIKFLVTFATQQAYVEVFARKNGQQNIATNIVGSQIINIDGTFSYSLTVPASSYTAGDIITARFYSYAAGSPGVFTPGPSPGEWTEAFIYDQSVCGGCEDVYEPNNVFQEATAIPFDTTLFAKIDSPIDRDWFTFTTTDEEPNIQIRLTNLGTDLDVSLYDAGFTFVVTSANPDTEDEVLNYASTSAGTYYFMVYGYSRRFSEQCYHLTVLTSANPFTNAARLGSDISKESTLSQENMIVYPNPGQADGSLTVVLNNQDENKKVSFRILDLNGSLVSEQSHTLKNGQAILSLSGIKSGIYVLDAGGLNKQKLIVE